MLFERYRNRFPVLKRKPMRWDICVGDGSSSSKRCAGVSEKVISSAIIFIIMCEAYGMHLRKEKFLSFRFVFLLQTQSCCMSWG